LCINRPPDFERDADEMTAIRIMTTNALMKIISMGLGGFQILALIGSTPGTCAFGAERIDDLLGRDIRFDARHVEGGSALLFGNQGEQATIAPAD
jgi:hypothetical protein